MNKLGGKETGIIDAHTLAVLFVVMAALGGVFWYVANRQKPETKPPIKTTTSVPATKPTSPDELPERYHDDKAKLSISYPGGWTIKTDKSGDDGDNISTATLIAPSQATRLSLKYQQNFTTPARCCSK